MRREVFIGIFLLVAIVLFIGGILWLADRPLFGRDKIVRALFTDASRIEPGIYVYIRGVKVGEVKRTYLVDDGVIVEFMVREKFFIPEDSKVEARSEGFLGEKALSLILGKSPRPLAKESVLKGVRRPDIVEAWEKVEEELLAFLEEGRAFLRDNKALVERLGQILASLSERLERISGFFEPEIKKAREELEEVSLSLKELNRTLQGDVLRKSLPDTLFYERLSNTLTNLDSLLLKLKKEPTVRVKLF